jgi:hypothetical protein
MRALPIRVWVEEIKNTNSTLSFIKQIQNPGVKADRKCCAGSMALKRLQKELQELQVRPTPCGEYPEALCRGCAP